MSIRYIQNCAAKLDSTISYHLYKNASKIPKCEKHLRYLEYSCHGIPWLVIVTIVAYTSRENDFWINLLIGLIFDIVYIAVMKACCRRRRPTYAVQTNTLFIDKLSFPSGHASRAVYVALMFRESALFLNWLIWLWALAVIISRVLYGRHFVGDILAGTLIGYFNFITQFTLLFPVHSFFKWFMLNLIYETIDDY